MEAEDKNGGVLIDTVSFCPEASAQNMPIHKGTRIKENMKKLLVVTSSVRENRIADNILKFTLSQLAGFKDYEITVADLKKLPMPFFNAPVSPSNDDFVATDENVIAWTKMVGEADGIVFLVAEYNYSMTAVLKNAIDWIYKEWAGKPVTFVGYGWVGGSRAIASLRIVMGSTIAAKATETEANLRFLKEIDLEGNIIDEGMSIAAVETVLEELTTTLGHGILEIKAR